MSDHGHTRSFQRTQRLAAGCLLVLLVLCRAARAGVVPVADGSIPGTELVRMPGGWLGVEQDGRITVLRRFDTSMQVIATQSYRPLQRIDLHVPTEFHSHAWLLAARGRTNALYRLDLDSASVLDIAPVWESTVPGMRRIVRVGPITRPGATEIALAGDSMFVVVASDGSERYRLGGEIQEAVSVDGGWIVATAVADGTDLLWLDATSGAVTARLRLSARRIVAMRRATVNSHDELIVATSDPSMLVRVDLSDHVIVDSHRLASPPAALVSVAGRTLAVFTGYPGPEVVDVADEGVRRSLAYPLGAQISSVAAAGGFLALAGGDSLVLYGGRFQPIGSAAIAGSLAPMRMIVANDSTVIAARPDGSTFLRVDVSEPSWWNRNLESVAVGALALLLLAVIALALRHNRFILQIYNNLFRARGSSGVLVMSRSQRLRHVNASARSMLDIAPYIPLRRHISEYLSDPELAPVRTGLRALFSEGRAFETKVEREVDGTIRSLSFHGRPMFGQYATTGYLLIVDDVTERIETERIVNWASVAHHIAHEMKTPLGTVRLTAEMLRDRLGTNGHDPEYTRATDRILRQSERLREIVEDLLTVARAETLHRTSADLGVLISSMAHEYLDYLPKNIEMSLEVSGEDFRADVDVQQLIVAVRNVLDNARHAIGTRDDGRIDLRLESRGEHIAILISDNGIGMPPETLSRIFQPFYTEREGGSGIGTMIVKRVIEGHGGSVEVTSSVGVGTRFELVLPRG